MTARPDEHLEREAKLGAATDFGLPDLSGVVEGVLVDAPVVVELDAVYFDTDDLRLIRAGITLRHRHDGSRGEWTVKLPEGPTTGGALLRREHTVPAEPRPAEPGPAEPGGRDVRAPPTGIAEPVPPRLDALVRAVARTEVLTSVARLHTTRRSFTLRAPGGEVVGEVDDDEVAVLSADAEVGRFREIEVEVADRAPRHLLDAVVTRLRCAGAGEPDPVPKLARALGDRAGAAPDLVVPALSDGASAAEVIGAALTASVARIVDHDRVIRADADPEGVHQARVGTRRLRSDLRTFAPLLDRSWSEPLRVELRWLAAELGRTRDADVLLARFGRQITGLPAPDRVASGPLVDRLRHERDEAQRSLVETLDGRRYLELLDRLVDAARQPRLGPGAAEPATDVVARLVAGPWRKLRRAVAGLGDDPSDDDLHQVRIRAKRARYAADVVRPVIGGPAAGLAGALADLQDVLGDLHDAAVAEAWLREATRALDPASTFAAGMMAAGQRAEAAETRDQWRAAWKAASARKRIRWLS